MKYVIQPCFSNNRIEILSVCSVTQLSLTSNEHDADGKDLLRVGVGGDVPKAHTGQTAEGEIECCDVLIFDGGAWAGVAVVVFFSCDEKQ